MENGFRIAWIGTEYSLAELRMAEPEQDSTEWLISWLSKWKMVLEWNSNFNLYNMKKSIIKTILGMVAACSLVLVCAESESLIKQVLWSGSWMGVFYLSVKGFEKCMTEKDKEERI